LKFERYGIGIAKGMKVTFENLLRKPVTTQYPEEKLTVSRRIRGTELIWNEERCSGCATCAKSCPQGTIKIKTFNNGIVTAPCSQACPAGVNIPRYLRFIAEGKPGEAVAIIREKIPFPSVCGRVCFHPCETKCQRTQLDDAISIRVLKRFATDHDTGLWKANSKVAPSTGKRVAVVGAGPSGLTAAYYLAKLGHSVTVFEALPEPGGMMRVGIPDYRLPKAILRAEIDEIRAVGVDIKTNTRVESLDKLFEQGYNAIFLALGAHQGMRLGVEGEDSPQVVDCAAFLRDVSLGKEVKIGAGVAVIGGGNAAIDSARTSLRLGAKEVTIVYRRTQVEMPANPEEVEAALAEGIEIYFLAAPSRIYSRDGKLQLECIRMQLGEPDASGRRRPEPIKGSEFTMSFDNIIAAIGQRPEIPEQFGLSIGRGNTIQANPDTLDTGREGVFAGGDAVSGPASVIEAIAAGRQGAISIDKYLGGTAIIDETLAPPQEKATPLTRAEKGRRVHPSELSPEERISSFTEVELELSEDMAVKEAERCLKCDLAYVVDQFEVDTGHCIFCGLCVEACPRHALFLDYGYEHASYRRQELVLAKEDLLLSGDKQPSGYARPEFEVALPTQTLLLDRERIKK
jgi:NADPH-dependent glutamate synthase beta subunit-like oxidoreductase/formate hydrogenlyase subunit 6/NADH:ubiquinone oxidoreductase subunit I